MISFTKANESLLNDLSIGVRALNLSDRLNNYESHYRYEIRERLREHFTTLDNQWQRKEFYSEVLDLLKEFEFEFLLTSIYFDEAVDYIVKELRLKLQSGIPPGFNDRYSLIELVRSGMTVSSYVESIFSHKFNLHNIAWPSKIKNSNPEANHLSKWIEKAVRNGDNLSEIRNLFIHFNKYWQLYFVSPFDNKKGIVLLTKVEQSFGQISVDALRVNLWTLIESTRLELSGLLSKPIACPLFQAPENLRALEGNMKDNGHFAHYLAKIESFRDLLVQSSIVFDDINHIQVTELFTKFCSLTSKYKSKLKADILSRFRAGKTLLEDDIKYLQEESIVPLLEKDLANQELYKEIVRINYLFHL